MQKKKFAILKKIHKYRGKARNPSVLLSPQTCQHELNGLGIALETSSGSSTYCIFVAVQQEADPRYKLKHSKLQILYHQPGTLDDELRNLRLTPPPTALYIIYPGRQRLNHEARQPSIIDGRCGSQQTCILADLTPLFLLKDLGRAAFRP